MEENMTFPTCKKLKKMTKAKQKTTSGTLTRNADGKLVADVGEKLEMWNSIQKLFADHLQTSNIQEFKPSPPITNTGRNTEGHFFNEK